MEEEMMMTYDDWADRYKPITKEDDSLLWDTHDTSDLKFLKDNMIGNALNIWTIVDDGEGSLIIDSGFRFVNRLAYMITEQPRVSEDVLVQAEYDVLEEHEDECFGDWCDYTHEKGYCTCNSHEEF
jgi:hypothetical protein